MGHDEVFIPFAVAAITPLGCAWVASRFVPPTNKWIYGSVIIGTAFLSWKYIVPRMLTSMGYPVPFEAESLAVEEIEDSDWVCEACEYEGGHDPTKTDYCPNCGECIECCGFDESITRGALSFGMCGLLGCDSCLTTSTDSAYMPYGNFCAICDEQGDVDICEYCHTDADWEDPRYGIRGISYKPHEMKEHDFVPMKPPNTYNRKTGKSLKAEDNDSYEGYELQFKHTWNGHFETHGSPDEFNSLEHAESDFYNEYHLHPESRLIRVDKEGNMIEEIHHQENWGEWYSDYHPQGDDREDGINPTFEEWLAIFDFAAESFSAESKFIRPYDGKHGIKLERDNKGRYRRKLSIPLKKR